MNAVLPPAIAPTDENLDAPTIESTTESGAENPDAPSTDDQAPPQRFSPWAVADAASDPAPDPAPDYASDSAADFAHDPGPGCEPDYEADFAADFATSSGAAPIGAAVADIAATVAAIDAADKDPTDKDPAVAALRATALPPDLAIDLAGECELAVLGAVLVRNAKYWDCARAGLKAEHFARAVHGRLWLALEEQIAAGREASPIILRPKFDADPELLALGGMAYLARLATVSAGIMHVGDYARTVREWAARRELVGLGGYIEAQARDGQADLARTIADAEAMLDQCRPPSVSGGMLSFADALAQAQEANERAYANGGIDGVPLGLAALDALLGGATKTDLVIVAGRPGMGKSALAQHIALHNIRAGRRVAIFSLEMSASQLANRAIAQQAGVSADMLRRGQATPEQMHAARAAVVALGELPMVINQTPAIEPGELRGRLKQLQTQGVLDLCIVDYLQLMRSPDRSENRVQEVSAITAALKSVAKDLNVPIVALSQLNRAADHRDDKRPLLADLRESGSIEQDADAVVFVYREHNYLMREEPRDRDGEAHRRWREDMHRTADIAELIVAKNRHGPCGTAVVGFDAPLMEFRDGVLP